MLNKYLGVLHRDYTNYMNDEFKNFPIDQRDFPVLVIAGLHEGVTTNEISRTSKVVKSRISGSANKLEKLGYIIKKEDPDHKQKKKIYLTASGKDILKSIEKKRYEWEENILSKLESEKAEIFMDILSELYSQVSEE